MPYYLHKKSVTDPAKISAWIQIRYRTQADAFKALQTYFSEQSHRVTYVASEDETNVWTAREQARFDTRTYYETPWAGFSIASTPDTRLHFAHLSIKQPGMIAYTKTPEHGHIDRQTITKPGRYLTEYLSHVPEHRKTAWIAECSTDLTLGIARTAEDILAVYLHGPSSCMDGAHWEDDIVSSVHPTAVYGDSDLGVAYFGSMAKAKARCVVWPDKKLYSRPYGDTDRLIMLLERAGYSKAYNNFLDGARIRAIREGSGWLMPYVDGCEHGTLDGKFIVLDDEGSISTQETCGSTNYIKPDADNEYDSSCDRCGDDYSSDYEGSDGLCDLCARHLTQCESCQHEDDDRDHTFTMIAGSHHCETCTEDETSTCERIGCDTTWIERNINGDNRRASRILDRSASRLCPTCAETHKICHSCDDVYPAVDYSRCPVCAVAERCAETETFDFAGVS